MSGYEILDPSTVEPTAYQPEGNLFVDLAAELGCEEMKSRLWYLDPGDAISYHKQTEQEEFYFVVDGPGQMRIGDENFEVPEGGCVRVAPETPRQVRNDTDENRHVWLIVGAPPVDDDGRRISDGA